MRLQLLEQNIGRHLKKNIWYKKDSEGRVVLGACLDMQIGFEVEKCRITDIHPVRRHQVRT